MPKVSIDWISQRDAHAVGLLESQCFRDSMTCDELRYWLRQHNACGRAARDEDSRLVGYMLYRVQRNTVHIHRIAVVPAWRRCGVGTQLVDDLIWRLDLQGGGMGCRIDSTVPDVRGNLFLQQCGFVGRLDADDRIVFDLSREMARGVPY